jgi:DNA-binding NarL/FixJ family response regulator
MSVVVKNEDTIVLTPRDIEIIGYLSNGDRFEDVAQRFCLSKRTIELHVNRLRHQFNCKTVSQLTCDFIRKGLIK